MQKSLAERLEVLRQLAAKYWRPLVSWMTGLSVLLNGMKAFDFSVGQVPGVTGDRWLIVLGVCLFVLVRFPRIAVWITRLILGPPKPPSNLPTLFRGPRPYAHGDVLPGRQREIDECWRRLQDDVFLILEGESGCGKSSLLNAALMPRAHERFHVVTCRIADDPFGKLHAALLHQPYRTSSEPVNAKDLTDAIVHAAASNPTADPSQPEPPTPLLVCIDQGEELFVTVKDTVRGQFLTVLSEAISNGYLRLLAEVAESGAEVNDEFVQRYELMHEHLVQILTEAPDPVLQKAKDAEERLSFWMNRTRAAAAVHTDI